MEKLRTSEEFPGNWWHLQVPQNPKQGGFSPPTFACCPMGAHRPAASQGIALLGGSPMGVHCPGPPRVVVRSWTSIQERDERGLGAEPAGRGEEPSGEGVGINPGAFLHSWDISASAAPSSLDRVRSGEVKLPPLYFLFYFF